MSEWVWLLPLDLIKCIFYCIVGDQKDEGDVKGWFDGHPEIGKMQKDVFDDIFDTKDDDVNEEVRFFIKEYRSIKHLYVSESVWMFVP